MGEGQGLVRHVRGSSHRRDGVGEHLHEKGTSKRGPEESVGEVKSKGRGMRKRKDKGHRSVNVHTAGTTCS